MPGRSGNDVIDDSMHVFFATISPLELAFWIALPVYMAVGVILWCSLPVFRQAFRRYRYVGGMIAAALIWPFMLLQVAVVGIVFSIGWLSVNLLRLFRRAMIRSDFRCATIQIAPESFSVAGRQNDPAMINKERTNENNTDVDRWADARRLGINGKPCS